MTGDDPIRRLMDAQADRLRCAIYPTRIERLLDRIAGFAYARSEFGVFGRIGDLASDLRHKSTRRRAARRTARREAAR